MVVRQEQVEVMWEIRIAPSRSRIVAALRNKFPREASLPEERMITVCNAAIKLANQYGLTTEFNVYVFLAATLVFGEHFSRIPWSRTILADDTLNEEYKAKLIELRIALETGRCI